MRLPHGQVRGRRARPARLRARPATPPSGSSLADGTPLDQTPRRPNFGLIYPPRSASFGGLRVEVRKRPVKVVDPTADPSRVVVPMVLQYGRKVSDVEATVRRIRLFLTAGVLGGTLLALLGGVLLGPPRDAPGRAA